MYLNVVFTYYYSYKLFYFTFQSVKLVPYQLFHSPFFIHSFLILVLRLSTLVFSTWFINYLYSYVIFYFMVPRLKFLPLALNSSILVYLILILVLPTAKSKVPFSFFSTMLYLRTVMMTFTSFIYIKFLFNSVKSLEIGLLNYSANTLPRVYFSRFVNLVYLSLNKVQIIRFMSTFIFFVLYISTTLL